MPSERPRGLLPTLFSIVIIDLIGFGIVIPILPFYAKTYDADGLTLGALLTSHAAMQFVFAPIWGRLSDRFGRRPVMLITIAGTSVSLLALGLADSLVGLFAARLMSGVFAANISVATAYVTDVTAENERTKWMGMIGASFAVGFTLGPPIGGLLASYGHSMPMFVAAAMAAVNFGFALWQLREPEAHTNREGAVGPSMGQILRDPLPSQLPVSARLN